MKTYVQILGLVFALYGNAQPQHWSSGLQHSHSSLPSGTHSVPINPTPATMSPKILPSISTANSIWNSSTINSTKSLGLDSNLGLPPNCYRPNGVPTGWLPNGIDIMTIQNQVSPSHGPCTYGNYAHITSATSMSGPDSEMDAQALPSSLHGAVYTIALQPFIPFSQVSASAIAASMNKLLAEQNSQTSIIWLRLAHEMNWYIDTNPSNTDPNVKYHGTTAEFKSMWQAVAMAVDRARVKMFWSPVGPFKQGDTVDTLDKDWFPGHAYVDIVGLDAYGQVINGKPMTFEKAMGAFCNKYANFPVALAETGWLRGGTKAEKEYWLREVSSKDTLRVCPRYIGFSWFEYDKAGDGDYRIVTGPDGDIAKGVLGAAAATS